jgi:hypothetical protein
LARWLVDGHQAGTALIGGDGHHGGRAVFPVRMASPDGGPGATWMAIVMAS